jgi:thiamine biosynthesis lipoprotein
MGTTYSVKVVADALDGEERQRIAAVIEETLAEVNRLMSTYDPDSELSRLNRHRSSEPFPVSPPTLEVLRVAQSVSELSGGAFDVTVGPLVAAWGFGADGREVSRPTPGELEQLRERVGYELVSIDVASSSVSKANPDTVCDLSAVAKGYAVDRVAAALLALGFANFLVEVGGEVKVRGENEAGAPWRLGIEAPDQAPHRVQRAIELRDAAMATSGDYRSFYLQDGARVSHIIDPRSGRPIDHNLAAVSVIHEDAVYADALATALLVLGPEAGYALAEREGLAAYFIVREADAALRSFGSPAFEIQSSQGASP